MHEIAREARSFRFGPFELAGGTGELRREGKRVSRLQAQPLQVLLMLLECPGEVVTRDELRQKIWSSDTFVDFDHGVNTAINKLRSALGESASSPRFIETLPRIGYRFIAAVEALGAGSLQSGEKPETRLPAQTPVTKTLPENAAAVAERTFLSQADDLPAAPHRLTRLLFFL
ncbi:MAG: winged helix-turn-helix domain-containing protein, partial [Candidatus Acidiferrales bacterium]